MPVKEPSFRSLIDQANALEEAGKLEEALIKRKEVRAVRDSPLAALRHATLARALKRWDEAEQAALSGIDLDPTNQKGELAYLYRELGIRSLHLNEEDGRLEHLERARTYFRKAIEVEEVSHFYLYLGVTYMRTKDDAKDDAFAERYLRKALELDPSDDEAMYNLAEVIRCSREGPAPVEAVELYRKSLAIDPNYAAAYRGLAYIFWESKQFEEAEDYARRALKLDRTDWAAHTLIGELLQRNGQLRAAKTELQRGAALGVHWWKAQAALAKFYDDHGSLKEAEQAYRRCLDLEPENAWANRRYGAVLASQEKPVAARAYLKRAIGLDPTDRFAPQYLENLDKLYPHRRVPKRRVPRRKRKG